MDKMKQPDNEDKQSQERDPMYFGYYAQFQNQANMLQDTIRTSMYQTAISSNGPTMFLDKTVMDVGAGSGIFLYLNLNKKKAIDHSNSIYAWNFEFYKAFYLILLLLLELQRFML